MKRADLVPDAGMRAEIAGRGLGAVGANDLQPRHVGGEQRFRAGVRPAVDQHEHRLYPVRVRERQEDPAALLAPLQDPGIGEDLQVARDARLALAKDLRQLAHRQLHLPEQREDAQPGRVGERLEMIG